MSNLAQKRILLGITGGIAAYKSIELIRLLTKAGAEVQVVLTDGAKAFVTEMTLQAISGHPVRSTLLDPNAEAGMGHIELAKWADLIVIAPASADFMARYAQGMANDLLSTLCLATEAPVLLAPAMNQAMWRHPATQANAKLLTQRGVLSIGPADGAQACGDIGPGRMSEPNDIFNAVITHFQGSTIELDLTGQHWVITAGPTMEAIDPVRYISNHSSGKMGYALAASAIARGAKVTLISGPVQINAPAGANVIAVKSADDMLAACEQSMSSQADVFIGAAAVADFKMKTATNQKMKKQSDTDEVTLTLVKNPDIIATLAQQKRAKIMVGFAAETQNLIDYAKGKLERKGLDIIIANDVSRADIGFNQDDNQVTVITQDKTWSPDKTTKNALAGQLVECIIEFSLRTSIS
ncbi:bifunctional phosphopantothenoylcysteine decarboxylase/phosphopantothenate--cysteine ligase CoaBC [Marinomonas sp. M1K-6]|uniref:Coenzyme A biosynthesis bifunctional protein CoaBC n=1 Tax=Marinomonas profundi TaxID=2726122 RepID=A0A847R5T4_9GAMM|nr:bifunctional phosphopantothenoylcysteine decarboxylase/phosphopantothenate--cysteine ligase CoaBC [Marinomonas profundi]NLQ17426.1 bifunctional phosphopantothenoylcysteine decarboxylase/phosphopantothenate--cysteine ligase CoaBC [Marinomonas profundi]UDV01951.1 bifunctional phosphopantothenoylcysteine decarboxylase/phosphopantothenate--cysteine ligase CoaBC [Marinomonas profundi]